MQARKAIWLEQVHADSGRLPSISLRVASELVGYAIGRLEAQASLLALSCAVDRHRSVVATGLQGLVDRGHVERLSVGGGRGVCASYRLRITPQPGAAHRLEPPTNRRRFSSSNLVREALGAA